MSELSVAALPSASPLAAWLASSPAQPRTAPYHGVLTPQEFDARASESEALIRGAAMHDLGWLRRVQVRGEDRFRWLSGMVTNTVNDLPANGGAWNLVLNAQGRIQGDLTVWREGDTLELEITLDQLDRLTSHLDHFIIMDDVELVPRDGETALGLTGPQADEVLKRMGLPTLSESMTQLRVEWNGINLLIRRGFGVLAEHYQLWTPIAALYKVWKFLTAGGASPVGCEALEAFRVAEGIPAYGIDIVERDLPQETSQTRTLCFNKGCYLGQEIVERIRSRGNVHRHLRTFELDGPLPAGGAALSGAVLILEGTEAGHITSAATLPLTGGTRHFALAMVKAEAELPNRPLTYAAGETTGTARLLMAPPAF